MKIRKKRKFKKAYWYWLLIDLTVAIIVIVLLLYKPAGYAPSDTAREKEVSSYLTHELSPQLYNGAQCREPFDLTITQKGINDIITRSGWPKESDGIRFSTPKVFFVPESIVLMGTAVISGVELVVTVVCNPFIDKGGLLNLRVDKVKIGAMNITLLAKAMAKKMYAHRLATTDIDTEELRAQIAASLLNNEPFEPAFRVDNKKLRVEKITVAQEELTVRLVPATD